MIEQYRAIRDSSFELYDEFVYTDLAVKDQPISTYNGATAQNVVTWALEVSDVTGFMRGLTSEEIGGIVLPGDVQFIINHDDVGVILTPNAIITANSINYIVLGVVPLPPKGTITQKIHARAI